MILCQTCHPIRNCRCALPSGHTGRHLAIVDSQIVRWGEDERLHQPPAETMKTCRCAPSHCQCGFDPLTAADQMEDRLAAFKPLLPPQEWVAVPRTVVTEAITEIRELLEHSLASGASKERHAEPTRALIAALERCLTR